MNKQINKIRSKLTGSLTAHLGKDVDVGQLEDERLNIKKVLIVRPNHRLGNQLLTIPLVREVAAAFPNCTIDLFLKGGLGPVVFQNFDHVDRIIMLPKKHFSKLGSYLGSWRRLRERHYDLVLNVVSTSSSGRLAVSLSRGRYKLFGEKDPEKVIQQNEHIAKSPVYALRKCLLSPGEWHAAPIPTLSLELDEGELASGKKIRDSLVPKKGKTISLFTYATGSKCYSIAWWSDFHAQLKEKFPDSNILEILPVERVSQIDFKEPYLYSKDIREMASVIASTDIFIGADSGIMHLASAAQVPTVGLFSNANIEKYQPYNAQSLGIDTQACSIQEIMVQIEKILFSSSKDKRKQTPLK